ncbi:MAG: cold-shock protein [Candidatus Latescibacterota bacterium]
MAHTGTVKWYNAKLGYGFIQRDGGEDVFVHHSAIRGGVDLVEGERVRFEVAPGPRGPMATQVEPADD